MRTVHWPAIVAALLTLAAVTLGVVGCLERESLEVQLALVLALCAVAWALLSLRE